jgi:hypothetical protein
VFEISRTGSGTDTAYNFDTVEENVLSAEDKKNGINFAEKLTPMSRAKLLGALNGGVEEAEEPEDNSDDINF